MAEITILGSGAFGLALAVMCRNCGHDVTVWSKFEEEIDEIRKTGELSSKLAGVKIPSDILLTTAGGSTLFHRKYSHCQHF